MLGGHIVYLGIVLALADFGAVEYPVDISEKSVSREGAFYVVSHVRGRNGHLDAGSAECLHQLFGAFLCLHLVVVKVSGKLQKLSYKGDDYSKAQLGYCNKLRGKNEPEFTECMVFDSLFHTEKDAGGS